MNPTEVELKLAIAAESVRDLRRHPLIAAAERRGISTLDNTYFDTAGLHLRRREIGLRIRRQGRRRLQTVKCTGIVAAGLSSRNEWEQPFQGHFDFGAVGDAALRNLLERRRAQLVPVFTTRFRRERWIVRPAPGCEIEIALDRGEILAGTKTAPICEIELELLKGPPAQLLACAQAIAETVPLLPDNRSKAERGYALQQDVTLAQPRRAVRVALEPKLPPVAAFCRIAWECIDQVAANMHGALQGDDPEYAHQMRVGVRRLRSALRLFRVLLPQEAAARIRAASRELAQLPAASREWDVLIHDIIEPAAKQAPGHPGLADLIAAAQARRDVQREAMRAVLRTPAPGATLLALMREIDGLAGTAPPAEGGGQPELAAFAALRVTRLGRRVRRAASAAECGEPAALHELRLALKRLRYSLEFVGSLVRARHDITIARLAGLQSSLGLLNDLHVSGPLVESLAQGRPELVPAIALVGGHHLAAWHALAGGEPLRGIAWKKLRRGWTPKD